MGLNLSIRRIIFNSIYKNNGETIVKLDHSSCKQIAGRAGRRNSPFPNGVVTTRCPKDIKYVRACMETEIEPLSSAGLVPSPAHIALFSEQLIAYSGEANMELHQVLVRLECFEFLSGLRSLIKSIFSRQSSLTWQLSRVAISSFAGRKAWKLYRVGSRTTPCQPS